MQDDIKSPRTARDALLIELLGDLGLINDKIKTLPTEISEAIHGSLSIVIKAVEDAEHTATLLSKSIDIKKDSAIKDIDEAVKNSLNQHVENTFSSMDEKVKKLQHKINTFDLVDPKSRRLSLILSITVIFITIISSAAVFGIYTSSINEIDELNQIISIQDTTMKKGLSALSPQAKEQYLSAANNH